LGKFKTKEGIKNLSENEKQLVILVKLVDTFIFHAGSNLDGQIIGFETDFEVVDKEMKSKGTFRIKIERVQEKAHVLTIVKI
jgi:hypothetical protein